MKTATLTAVALALSVLPGCGWFSKETPPVETATTPTPAATPAVSAFDPLPPTVDAYWKAEEARTHAAQAFNRLPSQADPIEWYVIRFQMYDATERSMLRAVDVAGLRTGDERAQWAALVRQLAGQTEFLAADLKRHHEATTAYLPGANIDATLWTRGVLPPGAVRDRNKQAVAAALDKVAR